MLGDDYPTSTILGEELFLRKKRFAIIGVVFTLVNIGVVFHEDIRNWINDFATPATAPSIENGELIIDDFTSSFANALLANRLTWVNCKPHSAFMDDPYRTLKDLGVEQDSNEYIKGPTNILFYKPPPYPEEGTYRVSMSFGEASFDVPEQCWSDRGGNAIVITYEVLHPLPRFSKFSVRAATFDSWEVSLDFVPKGGEYSSALWSFLRPYTEQFSQQVPSLSKKITETGMLEFDLNTQPQIPWDQIKTLVLTISGHGNLLLYAPKLIQ